LALTTFGEKGRSEIREFNSLFIVEAFLTESKFKRIE